MVPLAPPRLSMTTGRPSASLIFGATSRATTSSGPGGNGTTMVIGRAGQVWAGTSRPKEHNAVTTAVTNANARLISHRSSTTHLPGGTVAGLANRVIPHCACRPECPTSSCARARCSRKKRLESSGELSDRRARDLPRASLPSGAALRSETAPSEQWDLRRTVVSTPATSAILQWRLHTQLILRTARNFVGWVEPAARKPSPVPAFRALAPPRWVSWTLNPSSPQMIALRTRAVIHSLATTVARIMSRMTVTCGQANTLSEDSSARPSPPAPTRPSTVDSRTLMSQRNRQIDANTGTICGTMP